MAETIQSLIDEELIRSDLGTDSNVQNDVLVAVIKALNSSTRRKALVSLPGGEGDLDVSVRLRRVDPLNVTNVRIIVRQVVDDCVRLRQGV